MVFITDIRKNKKSLYRYKVHTSLLDSFLSPEYRVGVNKDVDVLNSIKFDLVDTATNKSYPNVSLKDIPNFYKSIFGVSFSDNFCFFSIMDKDTWTILDYIDGIESLGRFESPEEFYVSLGNKYQDIVKSTHDLVICKDDTLIVNFRIGKIIKPLDDAMVFWYNNSINAPADGHFTIFDVYLSVFLTDGVVVTPETTVYVYVAFYHLVYKLDINQKVVRFMTKYKTFNRQV